MRHIVIGDIHGCIDELHDLIEKVSPSTTDKVVFLGDLVHKGPHSLAVLRYVKDELPKHTQVVCILGNHDEKHILWHKYQELVRTDAVPRGYNPPGHTEGYAECGLDATDIGWLDDLPVFYQWPGYLAVHAGVSGTDAYLLEKCRPWSSYTARERRDNWNNFLRVRFQDRNGNLVKMGEEKPGHVFWADEYDGRFGTVIFGHHVFRSTYLQAKPKEYAHAIGIDMGCVHGGYLCAAVHSSETDELTFTTVKSRQTYAPFITIMKRIP